MISRWRGRLWDILGDRDALNAILTRSAGSPAWTVDDFFATGSSIWDGRPARWPGICRGRVSCATGRSLHPAPEDEYSGKIYTA